MHHQFVKLQVLELCPAYCQAANGQRTECDSSYSQGTHRHGCQGLTADSVGWQQRAAARCVRVGNVAHT